MPQAVATHYCHVPAKQLLFRGTGSTQTRRTACLNAAKPTQIRRVPPTCAPLSTARESGKTPTAPLAIKRTIRALRRREIQQPKAPSRIGVAALEWRVPRPALGGLGTRQRCGCRKLPRAAAGRRWYQSDRGLITAWRGGSGASGGERTIAPL